MPVSAVIEVNDLGTESLRWYRNLSRSGDHYHAGLFVAEGAKVVSRLLASPLGVVSVLCSRDWYDRLKPALADRAESIVVYLLEKSGVEALTGRSCYQPVKSVARIPESVSLETLLGDETESGMFVALEGVSNAENVGSIVRNSAGFGASGLLVSQCSSSPYLRRSVHASMGTIFQLPVVDSCDLIATLGVFRSQGVRCLAAHPPATGQSLARLAVPERVCVVFGSEGQGLSAALLEACDEAVGIPMAEGVDSLNVASSSAVFLYELQRHRAWMADCRRP